MSLSAQQEQVPFEAIGSLVEGKQCIYWIILYLVLNNQRLKEADLQVPCLQDKVLALLREGKDK